jgi:hypothetical protein
MRFIAEPLFSLRRELSHADLLVHAPENTEHAYRLTVACCGSAR